ncbi:MAG: hypothetical protein ACLQHL_13255 [Candidatus Cybelea sp.]|jgi:hypothetical protein
MEQACGFDRSQLYSDEGPSIGAVGTEAWAEEALATWLLRWNRRWAPNVLTLKEQGT